ncbi:MAG: hypothetical protein JWR11_6134 [Mycobacterium sp.]|nr:hypothetical protein [Mycobacterium sp.]MDT5176926.1 hypothetical protein [Mycobacterium sp.]
MDATRKKSLALIVGIAAIMVAIALCVIHSGVTSSGNLAGGSGDSSTGGTYTQPSVPGMSVDPTNMKMGSTMTETTPATALATMEASPTFKATPAPGCVNNGQCP